MFAGAPFGTVFSRSSSYVKDGISSISNGAFVIGCFFAIAAAVSSNLPILQATCSPRYSKRGASAAPPLIPPSCIIPMCDRNCGGIDERTARGDNLSDACYRTPLNAGKLDEAKLFITFSTATRMDVYGRANFSPIGFPRAILQGRFRSIE